MYSSIFYIYFCIFQYRNNKENTAILYPYFPRNFPFCYECRMYKTFLQLTGLPSSGAHVLGFVWLNGGREIPFFLVNLSDRFLMHYEFTCYSWSIRGKLMFL